MLLEMVEQMNELFPDRKDAIDAMVDCVLLKQHALLWGDPGTAKSMMIRYWARMLGCKYFGMLMTVETKIDELFGPINIEKYRKEAKFVRELEHGMCNAELVFIDEYDKTGESILNMLLTLLNEREYNNGGDIVEAPLISAFLAANTLRTDNRRTAFGDRILEVVQVPSIRDDLELTGMLHRETQSFVLPDPIHVMSLTELQSIQKTVQEVEISKKVVRVYVSMGRQLKDKFGFLSDRRLSWALQIAKVSAYLQGRKKVVVGDLSATRRGVIMVGSDHEENVFETVKQEILDKGDLLNELEDRLRELTILAKKCGKLTKKAIGKKKAKSVEETEVSELQLILDALKLANKGKALSKESLQQALDLNSKILRDIAEEKVDYFSSTTDILRSYIGAL